MSLAVEVMNRSLDLLRAGVVLGPEDTKGEVVTRRRAIGLGHMVRLMKLYECLLEQACVPRAEITMIFMRLIHETAIRLEYLISSKPSTFRHFVLVSYRPEREQILDLTEKAKQRKLIPIEKRMLGSIRNCMRRDRVRMSELRSNKRWDRDGKNFRELLRATGHTEWAYAYGFASGSHFVHGDWREFELFHLRRRGRGWEPKPDFADADPRILCPATQISLEVLHRFIRWNRSDPDKVVLPILERLLMFNARLDHAHELHLQARQ